MNAISKEVQFGAETFTIISDDVGRLNRLAKRIYEYDRNINSRHAYWQTREGDDGNEYNEMVRKARDSQGNTVYEKKSISKFKDPEFPEFPVFVSFMEPWTRYNKETGETFVYFDVGGDEEGNLVEELRGLGFEKVNTWYKAERIKSKELKKYVWRRISDS